jgi:hypothetical protein
MSRSLFVAVASAALCGLPCPILAGQKIPFDGTHYYSAQFHTVQFEKGHSYSMLREWRGINHAKDPASITHLTRLECHGIIDAKADGTFNAEGYCNHWDRDGDLWVGHWWNNSKMPVGRYEVVGGEGKYAGATGGGTAKCNMLKPPPDAQAVCEVTGAIELK